jgi:hypothetical protein
MEAKLAAGAEIDLQQHALLSSTLVRIGQRIGLDRATKEVVSLRDRLAFEADADAADASDDGPVSDSGLMEKRMGERAVARRGASYEASGDG